MVERFPIFLNLDEDWFLKEIDNKKIDAFEIYYWRRLYRVFCIVKMTNESLLRQLHIMKKLLSIVIEIIIR